MPTFGQRERKRQEKLEAAARALPPGKALPIILKPFPEEFIPAARRLHIVRLQMDYPEWYYQAAASGDKGMSRVALWGGTILAGVIICHIRGERGSSPEWPRCLYVRSIVTSIPRRGTGATLLQAMLVEAEKRGVTRCRLHVHVVNKAAIAMYSSLGFKVLETLKDFYITASKTLEAPWDAYLMERDTAGHDVIDSNVVNSDVVSGEAVGGDEHVTPESFFVSQS